MLRGSDDPAPATAGSLTVSDVRQGLPGSTYIVFDDQLLGDVLEVSLTHPLESIPNVLLDEFFCFQYYRFSIFYLAFSRIPVSSSLRRLRRTDSQVRPRVGLEESGQEW